MPEPVIETVQLAQPNTDNQSANAWGQLIVRQLIEVIQQHGQRINGSIHEDGGIVMANPLVLQPLLTAALPPAPTWPGGIVFVTDGGPGAEFQGSNGVVWVPLG